MPQTYTHAGKHSTTTQDIIMATLSFFMVRIAGFSGTSAADPFASWKDGCSKVHTDGITTRTCTFHFCYVKRHYIAAYQSLTLTRTTTQS